MSTILVFLQNDKEKIAKASLSALTAAKALKDAWGASKLVGLCLGPGAAAAAEQAAGGALDSVLFSEDEQFASFRATPFAEATALAADKCGATALVLAATSSGKDFAPRVAAKWEAGQASDIVGVNGDGSLKRPIYAGNAFADVKIETDKKVVTVRATGFDPAELTAGGSTEALSVEAAPAHSGEVVSLEIPESERPELSDAQIVVSGGRALQSSENFEKYIFPLADALGAAVGASRAAVDSGYAPNDWQVGQTGKVVAPSLYIAIGISGAIQHLAGMKDSKVIVAINKDPDAPIFEIADYGLVADLYEAVGPFTDAVKQAKG